ncbi:MAG: bifunctional diaminohydroxyphosphoribosylaminopyrimidine deaminase/5-amino-6-(5-phosphoribosylamino)uracil reductase RibD [Pseudonocardiaceae bacterium]
MATPHELAAIRRAIALSAFGLGTTSPNPPVGCVILDRDGQLVGQDYHRRKGEAHAEALALAGAGERARGGTAVVTLEPCNHYSRTPPCHQALIDAGIRRVLVALIDPTSRGEGGVARLQQAGLEVEVGVVADEARIVLGPWLQALKTKRPHVHWLPALDGIADTDVLTVVPDAAALKASHDVVLTADGKIIEAVAGGHGDNLTLPRQVNLAEPKPALDELHRGGVRSVLLVGGHEQIQPFIEAALIDLVTAYVSEERQHTVGGPANVSVLPDEVQLVNVIKLAGWVRVCARAG